MSVPGVEFGVVTLIVVAAAATAVETAAGAAFASAAEFAVVAGLVLLETSSGLVYVVYLQLAEDLQAASLQSPVLDCF